MNIKRRYIKTRLKFRYAFRGVYFVWKTQKSFRYEIMIGLIANLILQNKDVFILSGIVLSLECVNTAVERICNFIHPRFNRSIGLIKDISAGSVAIMSIVSMFYGFFLIVEKIL